jgi:hypothetical protein
MTFTKTLAQWTVIAATVASVGMVATPAEAAALRWNLQGVTFNDGGTASGSFLFDADTNTFSDVNISTFLSNGNPVASYVSALGDATGFASVIPSPFSVLTFGFSSPLTNLGGEIALLPTTEFAFVGGLPLSRSISAGSVSAAATPIPTPALLPGLIGLGMGIARKRKQGETSEELEASKA